ncbi:hypothetical protein PoB_000249600 [Plakobranchus ocellatus]|uniref:Uncharacterized protein n=1 Tax=Plakobranchus ocellatus TaxID=259542 RepID=A0AAV3XYT2_9GAST|nr:hypothetical protein PoB_000249600 [Plakobranchus ocellatus]
MTGTSPGLGPAPSIKQKPIEVSPSLLLILPHTRGAGGSTVSAPALRHARTFASLVRVCHRQPDGDAFRNLEFTRARNCSILRMMTPGNVSVSSISCLTVLLLLLLLLRPGICHSYMDAPQPLQDAEDRLGLRITVGYLYHYDFTLEYLHKFYGCLCSETSETCRFDYTVYSTRGYDVILQVNDIEMETSKKPSKGSTFVCGKNDYKDKSVSCVKKKPKCKNRETCRIVKLPFPETCCQNDVIGLVWFSNRVTFFLGYKDVRSVLDDCETIPSTPGASQSTAQPVSWPPSVPYTSMPSTMTAGHVVMTSQEMDNRTSWTSTNNTLLTSNPVGERKNMKPRKRSKESEDKVSLAVGISCSLLLVLIIAVVVLFVLCRRRKAKTREETADVSPCDIQPYACTSDMADASYTDRTGVSRTPAVVPEDPADAYSAYITSGSVYCTIGEDTVDSPAAVADGKTEPAPYSNGNPYNHLDRPETSVGAELPVYHTLDEGIHANGEKEKAVNVYARLDNGREEECTEPRQSILETYDMGKPVEFSDSHEQSQKSLYTEVEEPKALQAKPGTQVAISGTATASYEGDENYSLAAVVDDSWQATNLTEYFVLENSQKEYFDGADTTSRVDTGDDNARDKNDIYMNFR